MPEKKGFLLSRQSNAGRWKFLFVVSETNQPLCLMRVENTDWLLAGRGYRLDDFSITQISVIK